MAFLLLGHGSIICYYRQMKRKNSTSNMVITLLDETGVDEVSIRRNRIRRTGPNSFFFFGAFSWPGVQKLY